MYIEVPFRRPIFILTWMLQLLLFFFPFTVSYALFPCNGCSREQSIQSDFYGIDFAFDYLSIAAQYINGTLIPIAIHYPGPEYLSLMRNALLDADIYPYGYGNEMPEIVANPIQFRTQCFPGNHNTTCNVEIFGIETSKLLSLVADQNLTITQYQVSTPTFFTNELNDQLMTAIQHSSLPPPPPSNPFLNPFPSDFAAFSALNTSCWLRNIEPEADCEFIDYMPLTILIVEFSDSVFSGSLYHFMGGRFYTRMVYFVDSVDNGRFDFIEGESNIIREDIQRYLERKMTRRLVDLIDDHKVEYWFSDIFKMDPLDIVIRGNRASDPISKKAVRVAITNILDGEWKRATEGKEKRNIMGNRQKDLNLGNENMVYVSSFGAARVAKRRIDEPKPLVCNAEGRKCMETRDRIFRGALIEGMEMSKADRERDEL